MARKILSPIPPPPLPARLAPPPAIPPEIPFNVGEFRKRLHAWYRDHARDLPWRGIHDPYATWLSEIMLQQTRVATVIDRYREFLLRFPTLRALADADESDVLALWSGLGYYRRARLLHRGAQFVVRELKGKLPSTAVALRTLPGVGDYTAAAIASIAFGESVAVLDGNVERVLLRLLGRPEERSAAARASLAAVAQTLIMPVPASAAPTGSPPAGRAPAPRKSAKLPRSTSPADHNQAMMELGATLCLPRAPLCLQCPVIDCCKTRGEHPTLKRSGQQSREVAYLLALRKRGVATEVLLAKRPPNASLMPDMLELPPLPLDAVAGREPALRVRHAITNTNYYAQIHAESAIGAAPAPEDDGAEPPLAFEGFGPGSPIECDEDAVFVANDRDLATAGPAHLPLLDTIPAASGDLFWVSTTQLPQLPLTGLARKSLQRLGVLALPKVRIPGA